MSTTILVLLALALIPVRASESLLWKIGEPDHSDHEFKGAVPRTSRELVVTVGTGDAARQWPRFHPGSGNGALGGTGYRYTLVFELPEVVPAGVFYLDLDLLFRQPRVPVLDLEVNGHRGRYYFEPEPMFDLGAVEDEFNPIRSFQHRRLALPAALFRAGANRLTFVAVDEPPVVIRNQNVGGAGDSGFFYDALALSQDPKAAAAEELQAGIEPTVFYPKTRQGVREACYLNVRFPATWNGGRARITLGDFVTDLATPKPAEFGEARYTFLVPPDLPATRARVELRGPAARGQLEPPEQNRPKRSDKAVRAPRSNGSSAASGAGVETVSVVDFEPARKWKLFYAPNEHLDVGYTDYRAKVAEVHARDMDELMTVLRRHPGYRFNLDGSWIADEWLGSRTARATAGLAPESKSGRIGVSAFYCSVATEYPSLEENIRNLYFSKSLERRDHVPFDFALVSDVPSVSWCVPSVLASAGIRYFANGGNQDRGPMIVLGHWSVRSPFWWEGPDGQRVLAWFSSHYHQFKALFGLPPALETGKGGVARFLRTYQDAGYAPDAVLVYGTEVENLPTEYDDAGTVEQWNARYAWPQLVTCRFSDFFRYLEKNYGAGLPVVRGTGGAYWADNFGTLAAATARDRANQSRAFAAETFATLAAALDPKLRFPRQLDHDIWRDLLLYAEHNFGIGGLNDRPESEAAVGIVKEKIDLTIRKEWDIDRMLRRSLSQLGDLIRTDGQNLLVFNPLGWTRSGLVQFQLAQGTVLTNLSTGQRVRLEVLDQKEGMQTVRFRAADVPAVGYQVYRMGAGAASRGAAARGSSGSVVENRFYRLTLDPSRAAVQSIYDKQLGRELVAAGSPFRANEYLFVSGGGSETGRGRGAEDSRLLHPFAWLLPAELDIHHPENGRLLGVEKTSWGHRIRMVASARHTPRIETEILLPDDTKEIEFDNTIEVDLLLAKQASYFAFPWAVLRPVFHYDIPNAFVDPARDLLEGGCSDWFAMQRLVNVEDGRVSVSVASVDAPLVCLGDICRGRWLARFTNQTATVFSYVLNNYWSPKWAGQKSAVLRCRYGVTSHARFDPARAVRWGEEARVPLEVAALKSSDKLPGWHGRLPEAEASLASVSPENLVLTALKPAEDGRGLVVRVLETAGRDTDGVVKLPQLTVRGANEANAVEVPGRALESEGSEVRFHIRPHQVLTLRVKSGN